MAGPLLGGLIPPEGAWSARGARRKARTATHDQRRGNQDVERDRDSGGRTAPPPPVQQPSDDELELDREMEYLVEPDEVEACGMTGVD